jgi:hypothetical protein
MSHDRKALEDFAAGYWKLEKPTRTGRYPIAARYTSYMFGYIDVSITPKQTQLSRPWEGWFWSEPLPDLPLTPDFIEDPERYR